LLSTARPMSSIPNMEVEGERERGGSAPRPKCSEMQRCGRADAGMTTASVRRIWTTLHVITTPATRLRGLRYSSGKSHIVANVGHLDSGDLSVMARTTLLGRTLDVN
uniref:Kinesin motor domain-containing protein n=1 Tax=Taenia asiatica TaxID=60517 RepID=A0A0R3WE54_TAEAS